MEDQKKQKLSHKGVPKHISFVKDDYLRCLYENDPKNVSYRNITISKQQCQAKTRSVTKRALNGLYMKFHVEANRVSIRPHVLNGKHV